MEHSYLGWCHRDWDGTKEAAAEFVRGLKHNSYFFWIEKSLQKLLGTEQRLDENTYPWFDQKIREFSSSLASDDEFLRNVCHYDKIVLDGYWEPGTNLGNPGLYTPTYRINQFLFGYQPDTVDDNGNNPFLVYGWPKDLEFDQYLDKIEEKITEKTAQGCVALKSSLPYDRSIHFKERTYDEAKEDTRIQMPPGRISWHSRIISIFISAGLRQSMIFHSRTIPGLAIWKAAMPCC